MDEDIETDDSPPKRPGFWKRFKVALTVGAAIAGILGVLGPVIWSTPLVREIFEERMVSQLMPGDDYNRIAQVIGSVASRHVVLESGRTLYIFDRKWEYITVLVSRSETALSVGVYAKTTSFTPTLSAGNSKVTLNGPPIPQQMEDNSIGASGG